MKPERDRTREEVEAPEGVMVAVEESAVTVEGGRGSLSRDFSESGVTLRKNDGRILLSVAADSRRGRAVLGTVKSHIQNMIHGVSGGVTYRMRIVYSHFPMNVSVQGDQFVIDNFLGEKSPRKARILEGVSVEVKGADVTLSGVDKERVAQTAANVEQVTRIKRRDPRVFQDGIYIIEKDGRPVK